MGACAGVARADRPKLIEEVWHSIDRHFRCPIGIVIKSTAGSIL